jgi:hypothetical protein
VRGGRSSPQARSLPLGGSAKGPTAPFRFSTAQRGRDHRATGAVVAQATITLCLTSFRGHFPPIITDNNGALNTANTPQRAAEASVFHPIHNLKDPPPKRQVRAYSR